jgi:hypothetical protein
MMPWETEVRRRFPAPDTTGVPSFYFSLDGGGRGLVIDLLRDREVDLMVEVGSFLCGSTLQWLESRPTLKVIAVDPWSADFAAILDRYRDNPVFAPCFSKIEDRGAFIESVRRHGPFVSALANVRAHADRVVPVRAPSPQVLPALVEAGVRPQLIYFDSNKVLDDLTVAFELFPDALLCGDDWTWGAAQGFPVQTAVNEFCRRHGHRVRALRQTWVLEAP